MGESYIDIEPEIDAIYTSCSSMYYHSPTVVRRVAIVRDTLSYKRSLMIACGIVFCQQVTGQPAVLYFATNIFKDAGFGSSAALTSVGVGFVKLVSTLLTVRGIDRWGRRVHLFIGITLMAAALAMLSTAFSYQTCKIPAKSIADCDENDVQLPRTWALVTAVSLMLYVSGYQIGFGPVSRLLISEVFPLNVRGAALSVVVVLNFATMLVMTITQDTLLQILTPAGLFCAYCSLTVMSLIFVWVFVPETQGKSLEQVQDNLSDQTLSFDRKSSGKTSRSLTSVSTADTLMAC